MQTSLPSGSDAENNRLRMSRPQYQWRVNRHPRFTVLELAEYMAADDGPRETILRDMKYERIARSLVYRTLNQAVSGYLVSPTRDGRILAAARATLEAERDAALNPRQRDNFVYELRALDAFERSANALQLAGLNIERAPHTGHQLDIHGLTVNIRPTAHIREMRPRGGSYVGALLIDTAKGIAPRTPEAERRLTNAMTYAAILLHQYTAAVLTDSNAKPSPGHSVVFHTHRQERVAAPSNYRRTFRNIEASCRGIVRGWANIVPPANFDPRTSTVR